MVRIQGAYQIATTGSVLPFRNLSGFLCPARDFIPPKRMAEGVGLSLAKAKALENSFGHKTVRFTDCQSN